MGQLNEKQMKTSNKIIYIFAEITLGYITFTLLGALSRADIYPVKTPIYVQILLLATAIIINSVVYFRYNSHEKALLSYSIRQLFVSVRPCYLIGLTTPGYTHY